MVVVSNVVCSGTGNPFSIEDFSSVMGEKLRPQRQMKNLQWKERLRHKNSCLFQRAQKGHYHPAFFFRIENLTGWVPITRGGDFIK